MLLDAFSHVTLAIFPEKVLFSQYSSFLITERLVFIAYVLRWKLHISGVTVSGLRPSRISLYADDI